MGLRYVYTTQCHASEDMMQVPAALSKCDLSQERQDMMKDRASRRSWPILAISSRLELLFANVKGRNGSKREIFETWRTPSWAWAATR